MKVLLTATVQSHIVQFHKPLVKVLHDAGYEVHVAARNNLAEKNGLSLDFVDKVFDVPFSRSPKSKDNVIAYKQLKKIIAEVHYDVIHCNTPMGGIVTRLAAFKARNNGTKVFYTAHGFHFYKGAPLKNWLVFYPIEKVMAHFCDKLITITKEDYQIASRKFKTQVEHIHGVGVYTERYHPVSDMECISLRMQEGLTNTDYVILCVGELNKNKNQKTLIKAVELVQESMPNLKVLLAGNGPLEDMLREQIREAHLEKIIHFIGYRTDLERITPISDLIVSCSYREGLPLNIIEAMLCKKPVIASNNRGHNELVEDGKNGLKFSPNSFEELAMRLRMIYCNKNRATVMGNTGYLLAASYSAYSVESELKKIYNL